MILILYSLTSIHQKIKVILGSEKWFKSNTERWKLIQTILDDYYDYYDYDDFIQCAQKVYSI